MMASTSTATELPAYPSFSLVKTEVHYPPSMLNSSNCYRTTCFQYPPKSTPANDELDYTDHADGGDDMANLFDDDDEYENERPRRGFRRRSNVLSIITEEDLSSSQSMEDDADADVQSERDENFIREAEEENPKRNAKGKFGGVAKSLRQFFHRHSRKMKKESRRVFSDSNYTVHPLRCKV